MAGEYWNVNSGGILRNDYVDKKETVVETEPQQQKNATSDGSLLSVDANGIAETEPNGKPTVSDGKGTKKDETDKKCGGR